MYMPVNNFLTLKQRLDTWNVPEFYKFFKSSTIQVSKWDYFGPQWVVWWLLLGVLIPFKTSIEFMSFVIDMVDRAPDDYWEPWAHYYVA